MYSGEFAEKVKTLLSSAAIVTKVEFWRETVRGTNSRRLRHPSDDNPVTLP